METAVNLAWNFFYENIWKHRCSAVNEWEKEEGIKTKQKRRWIVKAKNSEANTKQPRKTTGEFLDNQDQTKGKVKKKVGKEKEEGKKQRKAAWFELIKNYIVNKAKPLCYGFAG